LIVLDVMRRRRRAQAQVLVDQGMAQRKRLAGDGGRAHGR
jgi:hypothetical protein